MHGDNADCHSVLGTGGWLVSESWMLAIWQCFKSSLKDYDSSSECCSTRVISCYWLGYTRHPHSVRVVWDCMKPCPFWLRASQRAHGAHPTHPTPSSSQPKHKHWSKAHGLQYHFSSLQHHFSRTLLSSPSTAVLPEHYVTQLWSTWNKEFIHCTSSQFVFFPEWHSTIWTVMGYRKELQCKVIAAFFSLTAISLICATYAMASEMAIILLSSKSTSFHSVFFFFIFTSQWWSISFT